MERICIRTITMNNFMRTLWIRECVSSTKIVVLEQFDRVIFPRQYCQKVYFLTWNYNIVRSVMNAKLTLKILTEKKNRQLTHD